MRTKLQLLFGIVIGSFALHCAGSHSGSGGGGDGGVTDARADTGTCCTVTPQTFTNIAEGDIPLSYAIAFQTPPFDVSQYREIVVGVNNSAAVGTCDASSVTLQFKEPGSSVFIDTGQSTGRDRVDGPTAMLTGYGNGNENCTGTAHYVIVGVGLN